MHGKQILSIGQCVSECKGGSQHKVIFFFLKLTCSSYFATLFLVGVGEMGMPPISV